MKTTLEEIRLGLKSHFGEHINAEDIQAEEVSDWIQKNFEEMEMPEYLEVINLYKRRLGKYIFRVRDEEGDYLTVAESGKVMSDREYHNPKATWWFIDNFLEDDLDPLIEEYFDNPQNNKTYFRNRFLRHEKYGFTHIPAYAWPNHYWEVGQARFVTSRGGWSAGPNR